MSRAEPFQQVPPQHSRVDERPNSYRRGATILRHISGASTSWRQKVWQRVQLSLNRQRFHVAYGKLHQKMHQTLTYTAILIQIARIKYNSPSFRSQREEWKQTFHRARLSGWTGAAESLANMWQNLSSLISRYTSHEEDPSSPRTNLLRSLKMRKRDVAFEAFLLLIPKIYQAVLLEALGVTWITMRAVNTAVIALIVARHLRLTPVFPWLAASMKYHGRLLRQFRDEVLWPRWRELLDSLKQSYPNLHRILLRVSRADRYFITPVRVAFSNSWWLGSILYKTGTTSLLRDLLRLLLLV